jgi:hypothetical protein
MSKHVVSGCLSAALVACLLLGSAAGGDAKTYLCEQRYALCTSAPCVPLADDPTKATCFCDVEQGRSMSTEPCDKLEPGTEASGVGIVYSTFSLDQAEQGKKVMRCHAGTPWTQCLNKRCAIDPAKSDRAICVCDIVRTGHWVTFGGDCATATCETHYWSGATVAQFESGNAFMTNALSLQQSPAQMCR